MAENQQLALRENSDGEEVSQPEGRRYVLTLQPVLINTTPWIRVLTFAILAAFDMAMNAAAGASAATVGAHLNGKSATAQIIRLGALAGFTKAAITSFREVVLWANINFVFGILLMIIFTSWGICLIVTAEICNLTLTTTPKELLIAAVVAAIPLFFESIRNIEPKPDKNGDGQGYSVKINSSILSIFLIASNALGGYVFARMAANQGIVISNYHAACSAGAVFGTITFLARIITACITLLHSESSTGIATVFGTYELVQPEPITLSEKEYKQMAAGRHRAVQHLFKRMERIRRFGLRMLALLVCCVPGVDRKKLREKLRAKSDEPSDTLEDFQQMHIEMGGGNANLA